MKITGFETAELNIGLKKPFITSLRRVDSIKDIIIKIHTDSELVGYGEACAVTIITGATNESVMRELKEKIFPSLLGQEVESKAIFECLHRSSSSSEAKACVDIALYDLLAKEQSISLHTYLGAKKDVLVTDLTISVGSKEDMLKDTMDALALGFRSLKIKLDSDRDKNIVRLNAIIAVLPPQASLRLDPNQALDLESALHLFSHINISKIECIEQPFKTDDLNSFKTLTAQGIIPTLADESVFNTQDAQYLMENSIADMLNIKLMKSGGINEAKKIADIAKQYNKNCMIGSMLEGPVSLLAAAHFGLSQNNITMADLDSPLYLQDHPLLKPFWLHKNEIRLSKEKGLGIDEIMNQLGMFPVPRYS